MTEDTWVDTELEELLEEDAKQAQRTELDWGTLSDALDQPGWRDKLVSISTPRRRLLALAGLLFFGLLQVASQGIRSDLDPTGWLAFLLAGVVLMGVGIGGISLALRSRAAPPLTPWPWIPASWAFILIWSATGPWPGLTGVPASMHLVCFSATSITVLLSTVWIGLLERGTRPIPWRLGLTAAGAGCGAFVFQSVYCPGVDTVHLVVGHGGASLVGAVFAIATTLLLNGLFFGERGFSADT